MAYECVLLPSSCCPAFVCLLPLMSVRTYLSVSPHLSCCTLSPASEATLPPVTPFPWAYLEHVHAVHVHAVHAKRLSLLPDHGVVVTSGGGGGAGVAHADGPLVVLDNEDVGQLVEGSHVQALCRRKTEVGPGVGCGLQHGGGLTQGSSEDQSRSSSL